MSKKELAIDILLGIKTMENMTEDDYKILEIVPAFFGGTLWLEVQKKCKEILMSAINE